MLYADGELVLSPRPITPEKEVYGNGAGNYGKVVNQNAVPWNPNPFGRKPLSIQKVRVLDTIAPTNCSRWFMNCENLTEISNFEKLNVSNCNYFNMTFYRCKSLVNIDGLSNWNVSNGKNFQSMFDTCTSLVNIDGLSNWNVSNGTNFSQMFHICTSLVNIDGLSNWNVSNCDTFLNIFFDCTSLVNLDALKNWNVSNGTNFQLMFYRCTSLVNIDGLSNWNVSNGTNFNQMFYSCTSLVNLDGLQNWDVSNGNNFQSMFYNCTSLTDTSPLVLWLTNGTGMKSDADTTDMFFNVPGGNPFNSVYACLYTDGELVISSSPIEKTKTVKTDYGFVEIPTRPWGGSSVKTVNFLTKVKPHDVHNFFFECSQLVRIDNIENLDTSACTNMSGMFSNCHSLQTLDLSSLNTSKVQYMNYMFSSCLKLRTLIIGPSFDLSSLTSASAMFCYCNNNDSDKTKVHTEIIGASAATKTKLLDTSLNTMAETYVRAWN